MAIIPNLPIPGKSGHALTVLIWKKGYILSLSLSLSLSPLLPLSPLSLLPSLTLQFIPSLPKAISGEGDP